MELNPQLLTAHSLYGRSLLALGEQAAAERAFNQELGLNSNDFEANLQLGNMRKGAQRFAEASTYLERATTIRPNDLTARKLLASLRLQTGQVEEAVAMLEAIAKDAPDAVEVHVQLATGYNRLKRKDDADRERVIIDRLNAEAQSRQRGSGTGAASTEGPADERAVRRFSGFDDLDASPVGGPPLGAAQAARTPPAATGKTEPQAPAARRQEAGTCEECGDRQHRGIRSPRPGRRRGAAGTAVGRRHRGVRESGQDPARLRRGLLVPGTSYYSIDNFAKGAEAFRRVVRRAAERRRVRVSRVCASSG